ncbi:MAG TPA: hypothetical protein VEW48_20070 [Thermoanaerobaculia bacterium]|nr:hypothetical protein [Thermoanaerobaculia bacterium]
MKTDRFPAVPTRVAAFLLASVLCATALDAGGWIIHIGPFNIGYESRTKELSEALTPKVQAVQTRFADNRRTLHTLKGPGGVQVRPVQEVSDLISHTGTDLDQAIEGVGKPELAGLRAWSAQKVQNIQDQFKALPVQTASFPGVSTPRAVAVVASLEWLPLPAKNPAPPKTKTQAVPADASDRLLDQLGKVVDRIFVLASHDDLEVKLWVGSTPAQKASFSFWTQGKIKGTAQAPITIKTNGKEDHVLRGLYSYRAALPKGSVTELIAYPDQAGAPASQVASEQLDLVNGSGFFCCRFDENYCQHIASEKECHP